MSTKYKLPSFYVDNTVITIIYSYLLLFYYNYYIDIIIAIVNYQLDLKLIVIISNYN